MTILVVRHGETDGNAARILQRADVPLNERGMRQAEQLAGLPSRLVAANHDTSLAMLERTYSAFVSDFGDALSRRALLEITPPQPGKVVPLSGHRS